MIVCAVANAQAELSLEEPKEQTAMTLCIAVKCRDLLEPRVVCCYDAQVGNEYESSESENKWKEITPSVCAMYSGPLISARDLIISYKRKLKKAKLTIENYKDVLWKPMQEFSDANASRTFQQGDSDVELLVVAAVQNDFRILTLNTNGIMDHPYFAAIGTGQDSASGILRWRKPNHRTDLQAATYFAYEAKRLGEVSPYVGKIHTFMNFLAADKVPILQRIVTSLEISKLEEAFKRFGPQEFDWTWKLTS